MKNRARGPESGQANPVLIVLLVLGAILLVAGLAVFMARGKKKTPRNVLLIVADTLRADHLGCYGHDQPLSPNIDRLAGSGALFDDFNTVIPATLPSFASLLTSMHPKEHGAFRNGFALAKDRPRVSEVFRDAGFETAAFVASYCISAEFGIAQGFDLFDDDFTIDTGLPHNKLVRRGEHVSDAVVSWLRGRDGEKRFFAMVHYFDPHWPYDQPEPFRERFCPRGTDPALGSINNVLEARRFLSGNGGRPDRRCVDLHDLYCGEIAFMDREIGRVLDAVRELGIEEETLVVFTADHGETFWEHPDYFDHGLFLFDTNVRIPLIMSWPGGIEAGKRFDTPLCNIDLSPTLLQAAGLDIPPEFRGTGFLHLLGEEGGKGPEFIYAEACKPYGVEEGARRPNLLKSKSVRRGPWKFISTPFQENRRELFNLENDAEETTSLIRNPAFAREISGLEAELDRWAGDFEERAPIDDMDAEKREKLKALGYGD